ncbi:hypothetical protein P280DRAFT_9495 [Massarina eburnea CBS 473.64]|uniref:Rhodopsin domain-containing protein n=1 Tax=Massarina eburnea CBS 473.64 TaxID=1395130 RepID=A0A6A6SH75_9PLEO|nr:hypothetical protein P280DRAFT_9495 [Massarina eburnea CBS 473.64]
MANLTPLGRTTIVVSWLVTTLAFISLVFCTVVFLCAGRFGYSTRFSWISTSDGLNYAAFVVGVVLVSQNTFAILVEGQANHQNDLASRQADKLAKSIIIHEALWSMVNALVRISACLSLHRIFSPSKNIRVTIIITVGFSVLHCFASVLELALICRPFSAQWKTDIEATCGNQLLSFIILEITAIAIDCAILFIPSYATYQLQSITIQRRVYMFCVFDIGAVLLIIAGMRLKAISHATSPDFVYSKSYLALLSALGVMLAIILCAAVPSAFIGRMIKVFFRRYLHNAETPGKSTNSSYETPECREAFSARGDN